MILFGFEVAYFSSSLHLHLSHCGGGRAGDLPEGAARPGRPHLHRRSHRHPQGGRNKLLLLKFFISLDNYLFQFVVLIVCQFVFEGQLLAINES